MAAAADSHSAATVTAASRLAGRCQAALTASLLAQTGFDLAQLLCLPWLRVSRMQLLLPLDAVLFVLLVLVLARQYAEGHRLQEDSDSVVSILAIRVCLDEVLRARGMTSKELCAKIGITEADTLHLSARAGPRASGSDHGIKSAITCNATWGTS